MSYKVLRSCVYGGGKTAAAGDVIEELTDADEDMLLARGMVVKLDEKGAEVEEAETPGVMTTQTGPNPATSRIKSKR